MSLVVVLCKSLWFDRSSGCFSSDKVVKGILSIGTLVQWADVRLGGECLSKQSNRKGETPAQTISNAGKKTQPWRFSRKMEKGHSMAYPFYFSDSKQPRFLVWQGSELNCQEIALWKPTSTNQSCMEKTGTWDLVRCCNGHIKDLVFSKSVTAFMSCSTWIANRLWKFVTWANRSVEHLSTSYRRVSNQLISQVTKAQLSASFWSVMTFASLCPYCSFAR